ncbi:F-box protein SKIP19 isoform X2 [Brachypodium distachyon]|uniref:F-box protein SKIP19 isoform X2 n=1 Tax=Brachypodium distachyon TaxID=15368 RepID=UPI0005300C1D|nr:F-box protein SKIP19 isoform X2 [Brachypodium distachyon]|eukprot:XP_003575531.2 F-box protein SKIP19 isoform X2 [Brachypodium distachyon]
MNPSASLAPPPPPPERDWAALPRDVLWAVFVRAGQRELLRGAGFACAAWWRLARHEPLLWRLVDLDFSLDDKQREEPEEDANSTISYYTVNPEEDSVEHDNSIISAKSLFNADNDSVITDDDLFGNYDDDGAFGSSLLDDDEGGTSGCSSRPDDQFDLKGWEAMARAAVDRSAGQCDSFCSRANDELLLYIADRVPSLRILHITSRYDVSSSVLSEAIKKLPLLEELDVVLKSESNRRCHSDNSWAEVLRSAAEACSHLRHFAVSHDGPKGVANIYYWGKRPKDFAILTMLCLHSLKLFGSSFTRDVVLSIVGSCPNLQSLDLTHAAYLKMDGELMAKCSMIKDLRLQDDDSSSCIAF